MRSSTQGRALETRICETIGVRGNRRYMASMVEVGSYGATCMKQVCALLPRQREGRFLGAGEILLISYLS